MSDRLRRDPGDKRRFVRESRKDQALRELRGGWEVEKPDRNLSEAADWVDGVLERIGVRGGLEEETVKATWRKLAGEAIARQTEPVSLRKGCLTLRVVQPSTRFYLEGLKPALLKKLQAELGEKHIKSLRLTIG